MPQRLKRPRPEVESIVDRAIEDAEKVLGAVDDVHDADSYEEWVHKLERWHALTRAALQACYEGDEPAEEFYSAATGRIFRIVGQSNDETFVYYQQATRGAINTLRSLRDRLDYDEAPSTPSQEPTTTTTTALGGGIFLVHGHDEATKQSVARFLDRVTEPGVVILEEQPDGGRTLIEKFEQYASQAGYAVVLLTGDDEGRNRGTEDELRARARQNVVLELGFFIGALRRDRVALLYEEGVERPSDIDGVVYLALDRGGAWKMKLAREMAAAGVHVDTDALLRS